ncbi:UDP-Glycosyltransferase/glycogen phosphorylase, partial [Rozella allomycis CSF55]
HSYSVDFVAFNESDVPQYLSGNPNFRLIPVKKFLSVTNITFPFNYILMPFKLILQFLHLLFLLFHFTNGTSLILVQNPPSIPVLLVLALFKCFVRTFLIIDWHNTGTSILKLKFGNNVIVKLSDIYERTLSKFADAHLTVTKAMKKFLESEYGIKNPIIVAYDRPPNLFKALNENERNETLFNFLSKHNNELLSLFFNEDKYLLHERPLLIITSTSWTIDERFDILSKSLELLERRIDDLNSNPVVFLITGKGPLKSYFLNQVNALHLKRVHVLTAWLSFDEYPKVMASCDLGLSLHESSSGKDLPMKVLDMFGSGLPTCALNFEALNELVKHDVNGLVFHTAEEFVDQVCHFLDTPADLKRLAKGAKSISDWKTNWDENVFSFIQNVPKIANYQ